MLRGDVDRFTRLGAGKTPYGEGGGYLMKLDRDV